MSFKDKVAAGAVLIKDALQSAGFVPGTSGWQVRRDGGAEFSDLKARGDVTVSIGADGEPISVRDYLTRLANSGTNVNGLTVTQTTTPASIPGVELISSDDLLRLVLFNRTDPAIVGHNIDLAFTVSFDCHSTSSTGSGGHVQVRYQYADGTVDDFIAETRSGSDGGQFTMTISWSDSYLAEEIVAFQETTAQGPRLLTRHTGSTAYVVDSVVWSTTYQIT